MPRFCHALLSSGRSVGYYFTVSQTFTSTSQRNRRFVHDVLADSEVDLFHNEITTAAHREIRSTSTEVCIVRRITGTLHTVVSAFEIPCRLALSLHCRGTSIRCGEDRLSI
jgi:hypothetical protein